MGSALPRGGTPHKHHFVSGVSKLDHRQTKGAYYSSDVNLELYACDHQMVLHPQRCARPWTPFFRHGGGLIEGASRSDLIADKTCRRSARAARV